jgi:hypothetical protein
MGADRYSTANTCTSLESACRNLCEQVIATLPRELRDIIYEHILSQEVWDVAALPTSEPTSAKTGPHYWQVEKVGNATLREILEVWYRLVRFHIGQDLGYLKRFLTSKAASLDTSRQLLVTNISIAFDSRDVETHMQPTGGGVVRDFFIPHTHVRTTGASVLVERRRFHTYLRDCTPQLHSARRSTDSICTPRKKSTARGDYRHIECADTLGNHRVQSFYSYHACFKMAK